ncbi:ABC transporter A family member 8 [Acorus calamus]|uniref:ABC transporter A family member 8 n=1 Tax=Acorus calamus TaxID=4465 RepID=A0AAV9DBP8_ACOCL|nr:ABC transporter A family member 8 [Acorus calamus]
MDGPFHGPASFSAQANALMRKNLTFQGTDTYTRNTEFIEPAFLSDRPLYIVQPQCAANFSLTVSIRIASTTLQQEVKCVQGLHSWRSSSSAVNDEMFKGYRQGNPQKKINEIVTAYDFLNTNENSLNMIIWYNATYKNDSGNVPTALVRVPRSLNMVSNAYLQFLKGANVKMQLEYVKEMPQPGKKLSLDFASLLGALFFKWVIELLFPIALAFLATTAFSNVKTAQALGYIYVFGSGLLAGFLFQFFLEDLSFSRHWIRVMEILPAFALYRGLYEFSDYAFTGSYMGTSGMRWSDLSNSANGMREVLIIMFIEWLLLLPLAYYLDQLTSFGSSIQKDPLFFLHCFRKKSSASFRKPSLQKHGSKVFIDMEKPDVLQERETVEQLLLEPSTSHAIICDNLKKVYPGKDGIPDKFAVQGLSLALPRGECFGMLGPNGAGKTTFISMMIGLTKPTSGTAYVQGLDLRSNMSKIYTSMGVCPQHDMLWEMLTGREHLLFYGRLKNLKGSALEQAVEESLKSVNLYHGGVGDKQAKKYSGGMKRRLSVAISLIGDPKVC